VICCCVKEKRTSEITFINSITIISFLPVEGLIVNASEQLKTSEFQYKLAASATSALHAKKLSLIAIF